MISVKPSILLTLFTVSFLLLSPACSKEETKKERWPGLWQRDKNKEIIDILADNNIILCNNFKYKVPAKISEAYLVRCTPDSKTWSTYMVWIQLNRVMGPYETDPTMD